MALQVVGRGAVDGDAHAAHKVGAGGVRRRIVAALHARQHLPVPRDARVDELPDPGRWQVLREGQDERSEEHTSELQSLMRISYAVFCLKKKKKQERAKQYYTTKQY